MLMSFSSQDIRITIEHGRILLDINPSTLALGGLGEDDQQALALEAALLCPRAALAAVLDLLSDGCDIDSLHMALDAVERLRRDLQTWLDDGQVFVGPNSRDLTPDERRRILYARPTDRSVEVAG